MTYPVLAYIPSPPRGVWHIGPFPLRAYALCIIIGIVVAIWWGERRWRARGGAPGAVLDVAIFAVPFGLVGGRLYHVLTDWQKYFGAQGHPWQVFWVWQGGLGIWGAVLFGGIGAWIGCRQYRIPLPPLADAIAPGILLAQAIGRLGNYFNQELYGRPTDRPWGLEIYLRFTPDGQMDMMNGTSSGVVERIVQPTFLYELVWNVLGVVALLVVDRLFRFGHGRLFALYVAIYTFGRFWVELLRDDPANHIFGARVNSYTSVIAFVAAVAYVALATRGRESPAQLQPGGYRPWPWHFDELRRTGALPAPEFVDDAAAAPDESAAEPHAEEATTSEATQAPEDKPDAESEKSQSPSESGPESKVSVGEVSGGGEEEKR